MNHTIRSVMLVTGISTLAVLAPMQAQHIAAGAMSAVHTPIIPPPPPPPPAPSVSASSAAAASGAMAGTSAATGLQNGTTVTSSAAGKTTIDSTTAAAASGHVAGTSLASGTVNQASVTADPSGTLETINTAAYAARDSVNAQVQARLDALARTMTDLRVKAEEAGAETKAAFQQAAVDVHQREQALRASLKASAKATKESAWTETRTALARDYEAYASAMVHAGAAADGSVSANTK